MVLEPSRSNRRPRETPTGNQEPVVPLAEDAAQPERERTVQGEGLAVAHDPGPEVATDQEGRVTAALDVGEAAADAEVVGADPVAVEPFQGEVDALGVRDGRAELVGLERPVGCLEDRRSGLLGRGDRRPAREQATAPEPHHTRYDA